MRTIMFRGKSVMSTSELETMHFKGHDNGWFKGNLVMMGDTPYIVGDFIEVSEEYTINDFWVKVHPESVGQYTGIKSVNNIDVFDKDIIEATNIQCNKVIGQVYWNYGCWEVQGYHFKNLNNLRVIGNMYENEYLLEGEK